MKLLPTVLEAVVGDIGPIYHCSDQKRALGVILIPPKSKRHCLSTRVLDIMVP